MDEKKSLWYLINKLIDNAYDIKTFCNEFTRIYDLELDYSTLDEFELSEMQNLSVMTARFSEDKDELAIANLYFSEDRIREKVIYIKNKLKS